MSDTDTGTTGRAVDQADGHRAEAIDLGPPQVTSVRTPPPIRHQLKSHPDHFQSAWDRKKHAEIRFDDRGYREGDMLVIREWHPPVWGEHHGTFTGREITATITHISSFGQQPGYRVISFDIVDVKGGAR